LLTLVFRREKKSNEMLHQHVDQTGENCEDSGSVDLEVFRSKKVKSESSSEGIDSQFKEEICPATLDTNKYDKHNSRLSV
jgi:hypothetical protein